MRALTLPSALLLAITLAGCSHSRPNDYYVLESGAAPLSSTSLPRTTLAVSQVNLPDYLDRTGIVVRDANGALVNIPQFSIWAEPLDRGCARVLSETMAAPLLKNGITVLPLQDSRIATAYSLIADVVRLEGDTKGHVVLESRWTVIDDSQNRVLRRGSFTAGETIAMPPFGSQQMFAALVKAESRLMQQFGQYLAGQIGTPLASQAK